jgi:hypothetical protein
MKNFSRFASNPYIFFKERYQNYFGNYYYNWYDSWTNWYKGEKWIISKNEEDDVALKGWIRMRLTINEICFVYWRRSIKTKRDKLCALNENATTINPQANELIWIGSQKLLKVEQLENNFWRRREMDEGMVIW